MTEPNENQPDGDRDQPAGRQDRWQLPAAAVTVICSALGTVAVGAAWASYTHALTVVQAADGPVSVAYLTAGLADPTILAASVNIFDHHRRGGPRPWWSYVSVAVSLLVTFGANATYGTPHAVPAWMVNVWPPLAFVLALESLMSFIRRSRPAAAGAEDDLGDDWPELPETAEYQSPAEWLDDGIRQLAESMTERELSLALRVSRTRIRSVTTPAETPEPSEPEREPALNGSGPA